MPMSIVHSRSVTSQPVYTTERDLELCLGSVVCVRCEIEFYEEFPAIAPTRDEPGEPAQYAVVAIRPFETRVIPSTGRMGTLPYYLDCPRWLTERLFASLDVDTLEP